MCKQKECHSALYRDPGALFLRKCHGILLRLGLFAAARTVQWANRHHYGHFLHPLCIIAACTGHGRRTHPYSARCSYVRTLRGFHSGVSRACVLAAAQRFTDRHYDHRRFDSILNAGLCQRFAPRTYTKRYHRQLQSGTRCWFCHLFPEQFLYGAAFAAHIYPPFAHLLSGGYCTADRYASAVPGVSLSRRQSSSYHNGSESIASETISLFLLVFSRSLMSVHYPLFYGNLFTADHPAFWRHKRRSWYRLRYRRHHRERGHKYRRL